MNRDGLTITMVFEAQSANYGEGFGNISVLKKLSRGDGKMYSYISRQALRYNIVEQLKWDTTPVSNESKVVQFAPDATITDYPEIDLFGYMKTKASEGAGTRSAVARLSHAISLENYNSDMDYLNNMGLAKRKDMPNALAQSELHKSFYVYTLTLDLDRVGVDRSEEISKEEKKKRVQNLLKTIRFLYRDIKGRRENLSPVFVVGGRYERKTPYFEGRIRLNRGNIDASLLQSVIKSNDDSKNNTLVGVLPGIFSNSIELQEKLHCIEVGEVFDQLNQLIEDYYE